MSATLKKNILGLLKEQKLTVKDLETKAGLKPSAVSNILYDRSKNPTIDTLKAIAAAFDCSFSNLISDPEDKSGRGIRQTLAKDSIDLLVDTIGKSNKIGFCDVSAEDFFKYALEVYKYSEKNSLDHADSRFAKWIIHQKV